MYRWVEHGRDEDDVLRKVALYMSDTPGFENVDVSRESFMALPNGRVQIQAGGLDWFVEIGDIELGN